MAPYDSDSSEDDEETQLSYTETDTLLGYADEEPGSETVSRLGGRPDWFAADQLPSAALARCRVCKSLMVLLLQLNAELPDRFPGHERRLYILACRNKACRRKAGSIRAIRGVRVDKQIEAKVAASSKKTVETAKETKQAEPPKPTGTAPGLGEALFGVKNPFAAGGGGSANANPFATPSTSSTSTPAKNPFSICGTSSGVAANPFSKKAAAEPQPKPTPAPESATAAGSDPVKDLPKTFAETLALNKDNDSNENKDIVHGPPPPPEPWPTEDTWPPAYPVNWIADAEYETLDPTPSTSLPGVQMEVDDPATGSSSGGGKEDKYIFESSMDAAFQKFADRISQNPDQVIRYEFGGQPLLYSRDDAIAKLWPHSHQMQHTGVTTTVVGGSALPNCLQCGARRVFEVQLMPHAIDLLEADELSLEGMDWGTVLVGVCGRDCQAPTTASGEASYAEEWVGVQWEDLQAKR